MGNGANTVFRVIFGLGDRSLAYPWLYQVVEDKQCTIVGKGHIFVRVYAYFSIMFLQFSNMFYIG